MRWLGLYLDCRILGMLKAPPSIRFAVSFFTFSEPPAVADGGKVAVVTEVAESALGCCLTDKKSAVMSLRPKG